MPSQEEPKNPRATIRRDALRNRARILASAKQVFHARGPATTLDDIAAHAGVGVGTVYRNFSNKNELLEELFQEPLQRLLACVNDASPSMSAWDGIVEFLELLGELFAENPALAHEFAHADGGLEGVRTARDKLREPIDRLIQGAIAEGRLRPDFNAADIGYVNEMLVALTRDQHQPPGLWRRYLGLIVDGMQVSRAAPTPLSLTARDARAVRAARPTHCT